MDYLQVLAGEISIKFLQGTSDLDEEGNTISREYSYTLDETNEVNNHMNNYVVHPAFRDGTSNNFMNGEWDEEVTGFWVAKYEAGYQANTITDNSGVLSTEISNADDEIVYSDLKYTSYNENWPINAIGQDLSNTGYSNESLSYPVFKPLTYSYNNICIGDSYVLSKAIDTASNFYGLSSSEIDSHQMKNSEWGAVTYLTQSNYGRNGTEITINDYYTNLITESPYRTAVTGLVSSDGLENGTQTLTNISAYNTINGMQGSTTGNITGIYDLNGGLWDRISGYILNGNANLINSGINSTYGSSGYLLGATDISNPNGYLNFSTREYTVYPYNGLNDVGPINYNIYKGLLSNTYGYGDAILEISAAKEGAYTWNLDYNLYIYNDYSFFERGGEFAYDCYDGPFSFTRTRGDGSWTSGFRSILVSE